MLIGKTSRDDNSDFTYLVIPKEVAKELDIENSKVSLFLLDDFYGNNLLIVSIL